VLLLGGGNALTESPEHPEMATPAPLPVKNDIEPLVLLGAIGVKVPPRVAVSVTGVLTGLVVDGPDGVMVVAPLVGVYDAAAVVLEVAKFVSPK
jgi:hypothetical protein